jgi:hypothetical protein
LGVFALFNTLFFYYLFGFALSLVA